ncbi:MAG: 3'(2'),5'-bisphosphate nucleotidase CysQ [Candidatus Marinimicrobia bacterium]|nr:3'(2'),5'-bisphosphate nucleotidase CysQ [Candidatus Neomarinimicrobiota bacterium]|tara:strand:+ start:5447 stop:6307 length:861 start_codon:yes stop_codon:yes gene_type:complete
MKIFKGLSGEIEIIYSQFIKNNILMNSILKDTIKAVKNAGKIISSFYLSEYEVNQKGKGNPVTEVDLLTDSYLKKYFTERYPDYGWLSEETRDSKERLNKDRVWVVDPLDGTKEFIEGVPNFAVSIALIEYRKPILGVIYNPITKDLYTAIKGLGMKFNDKKSTICQKNNLIELNILNSRSETKKGLWEPYKSEFKELVPFGSIALKLAMVAANQGDFVGSLQPKNEWDICAGHCLINEAGGKLLSTESKEIIYNKKNTLTRPGLVAGNQIVVDKFLELSKINKFK